jgi:hypothetical protein
MSIYIGTAAFFLLVFFLGKFIKSSSPTNTGSEPTPPAPKEINIAAEKKLHEYWHLCPTLGLEIWCNESIVVYPISCTSIKVIDSEYAFLFTSSETMLCRFEKIDFLHQNIKIANGKI